MCAHTGPGPLLYFLLPRILRENPPFIYSMPCWTPKYEWDVGVRDLSLSWFMVLDKWRLGKDLRLGSSKTLTLLNAAQCNGEYAIRVSSHRDAELDNLHVPLPRRHVDRCPPLGVHRIHVQLLAIIAVALQHKLHRVDSIHRRDLMKNRFVDIAAKGFQKLNRLDAPNPNCERHEGFHRRGRVRVGAHQIHNNIGAAAFHDWFEQPRELRFRACGYGLVNRLRDWGIWETRNSATWGRRGRCLRRHRRRRGGRVWRRVGGGVRWWPFRWGAWWLGQLWHREGQREGVDQRDGRVVACKKHKRVGELWRRVCWWWKEKGLWWLKTLPLTWCAWG